MHTTLSTNTRHQAPGTPLALLLALLLSMAFTSCGSTRRVTRESEHITEHTERRDSSSCDSVFADILVQRTDSSVHERERHDSSYVSIISSDSTIVRDSVSVTYMPDGSSRTERWHTELRILYREMMTLSSVTLQERDRHISILRDSISRMRSHIEQLESISHTTDSTTVHEADNSERHPWYFDQVFRFYRICTLLFILNVAIFVWRWRKTLWHIITSFAARW